jgi:hypothetical protein
MGLRLSSTVFLLSLLAAGCGADYTGNQGNDVPTAKELVAARLVEGRAREPVDCRDNGAVNSELHPEAAVGYSCFNEAGEFYNIVIAPDGRVVSFSGPVRLELD